MSCEQLNKIKQETSHPEEGKQQRTRNHKVPPIGQLCSESELTRHNVQLVQVLLGWCPGVNCWWVTLKTWTITQASLSWFCRGSQMVIKLVVLYFKFLIKTASCLENVLLWGRCRYVLGKAKLICYVFSSLSKTFSCNFPSPRSLVNQ